MKKQFKLLSSILAALTVISVSPITFAAPKNNNKVPVYKKVFKYGIISAGVTAVAALAAVGAYKIFSSEDGIETVCGEQVIKINREKDFEKIKKYKNTITKAIVNVETIPGSAFFNCENLKEVDLSNVKNISPLSFWNCHNLEIISNSSNVKYISTWAFTNCNALKELDLPGVKEISEHAFKGCRSLERLNLPNVKEIAVTTLNEGECMNHSYLDNFRNSITQNCPSIKEVILPEDVTIIGKKNSEIFKY